MPKYIHKIGVELEGAWLSSKNVDKSFHGDGSVNIPINYDSNDRPDLFVGEIASDPISYENVENWIRVNYPDKVNHTCGFHIHVSLKENMNYLRLATEEFSAFFFNAMTSWGESNKLHPEDQFWYRLNGSNHYCKKDFKPDDQIYAKTKGDSRYTQLNFCYTLHGTLECRLLPMFGDVNLTISAFKAYIDCIEKFLEEAPNNLTVIEAAISMEDANKEEEECVY